MAVPGDDRLPAGRGLGLRWSDVDLDAGRASVRQQTTMIGQQVVTKPRTKTGKGRQIELDAMTLTTLRAWRARQGQERLLIGPE